jgi:hypothetical protein
MEGTVAAFVVFAAGLCASAFAEVAASDSPTVVPVTCNDSTKIDVADRHISFV